MIRTTAGAAVAGGECGERQVQEAKIALYASGGGSRAQFFHAATLFTRGRLECLSE